MFKNYLALHFMIQGCWWYIKLPYAYSPLQLCRCSLHPDPLLTKHPPGDWHIKKFKIYTLNQVNIHRGFMVGIFKTNKHQLEGTADCEIAIGAIKNRVN